MKFGDKLIELRKKNGYSQEELAEKLGVSRQSVSKWESNNTYPETDKIIQIANLFDCSMDDLINDKITDVESTLRKNKNNISNVFNSLLDFITSTVNMFSKMKFSEGFKCIIEMIILSIILSIIGNIICSSASSTIANIFSFLNRETILTIREIIKSIFRLIWFIISIITIIYTFKIRYLNYYEKDKKQSINKEDNNIENKGNNNEKIIIRDERPFEFLNTLSKIVIIFIKFIVLWVILGLVSAEIGLIVSGVVTISFISTNILFVWLTLLLVSITIILIQLTTILIKFIFDKNINVIINLIIFIGCIILTGVSIGMLTLSIKNLEIINDDSVFNLKTKELQLDYKDDLVIIKNGIGNDNNYKYIINNDLEDNKIIVSREIDKKYSVLKTYDDTMDNLPVIRVEEQGKDDIKAYIKLFLDNLKENKVVTFEGYGNDPLIIKANEKTVNKLIDNYKKLYLFEEERKDNEIIITKKLDKVYFKNGLDGEYYAKEDTIKYNDENYSCTKEIEKTEYGERIIYTCNYKEEEE